ncbi:hypothetical protein RHOFW104T7_11170 [Rhodanobacter thiooxydans]|uniref:Zinc finger/thioredoxin putative domain-containing protein n=1 Tax=Rhodanobacter thiooxydans TaxID=416169 RepID=A0A154QI54_9GAMM|nr:zinc-ribbon and DUF3426 domain-containing protein [Rhodanobacter thiooxydans]KZC23955.1 hypothetical protein RHOFW104T7_11170 [Rhodanobacter thiooxydans]MCW0201766.1 DUF3426 domain-containing protein [Rhodanobacter thiooxydans]
MYTQCPECLSVFSLDAQTLARAHGHVVCGHCEAGFDSLATLAEQLPPEPFVELSLNQPAPEPPQLDLVVYRPRPEPPAVVVANAAVAAATPRPAIEDFSQLVFAPRFAREPRVPPQGRAARGSRRHLHSSGERHWPWLVACLLLTLLLAAQLAWAKRDELIRQPAVAHWLHDGCAMLGCELPLVAAPRQLHLLASNVQAHPSVAGALMISASVRNDAAFAQPWPVLTVTLSDAQGQRIAMRRLQPAEYLDDATIQRHGLAPGGSAVLLLEVEDPGDKAVAFEIGFE